MKPLILIFCIPARTAIIIITYIHRCYSSSTFLRKTLPWLSKLPNYWYYSIFIVTLLLVIKYNSRHWYDCPGNDIESHAMPISTGNHLVECENLCSANSACVAYFLDIYLENCILKSALSNCTINNNPAERKYNAIGEKVGNTISLEYSLYVQETAFFCYRYLLFQ